MSDNVTPFDRFTRASTVVEAYPQDNRPEYKAFTIDKSKGVQSGLRILYHDANLDRDSSEETMPYPFARVLATSHHTVTLICNDGVAFILAGQNLKSIMEPLQDGYVRQIQRFHAAKFRDPEPDQPVINEIHRMTTRELLDE
ncbi:MAG: hypothetical protein AAF702_05020 [Chloroflexota bacterium]